jgi:hypothetical protein
VLDNLGMDQDVVDAFEGNEQITGDDGDDAFESNNDRYTPEGDPEPRQPQFQREFRDPSQQRQPQQQPQRPLPQNAEVRADQRGNLIGPDGRVVAKAGFEARMYQETQRARRELVTEQGRTRDLTSRLSRAIEIGQQFHTRMQQLEQSLNDRNTAAARLGLNDAESVQAMQLFAGAKTDPVGTLKKILTMAAAAGVDVTKIGIAPGGVDAKSLVEMVRGEINSAMNPLQQRLQQEQRTSQEQEHAQRVYNETESELNQFFTQNPDAREYIPVFHEILRQPQFQHMTMGEVWAKIQLNQMRMANDPQFAARYPNSPLRRQNPQPRRNLPSGRGNPSYVPGNMDEMAPVSTSYDAILRDTLDQLGVV